MFIKTHVTFRVAMICDLHEITLFPVAPILRQLQRTFLFVCVAVSLDFAIFVSPPLFSFSFSAYKSL
jgi:hypothetical protein